MSASYQVLGLESIPEISGDSNLSRIISEAAEREGIGLRDNDVIVVSSKVCAKAGGRYVDLKNIRPSPRARAIHRLTGKDPRRVQVILEQCRRVVAYFSTRELAKDKRFLREYFGGAAAEDFLKSAEAILLTEMADGSLATDAGTDHSNMGDKDILCCLPEDPKAEAEKLRRSLEMRHDCRLAVILSDSEVRMMRYGTAEIALAWSGIQPISQKFGAPDMYGNPKFGGVDATADQAVNAAVLLMGQNDEKIPVVILRGLRYDREEKDNRLSTPLAYQAVYIRNTLWTQIKLGWIKLFRRSR